MRPPQEAVERPGDRRSGFKMLGPREEDGLELLTEEHDIYLRKGRGQWIVDVFRAHVPDADMAHISSDGFPTLAEALRHIGGLTPDKRENPWDRTPRPPWWGGWGI